MFQQTTFGNNRLFQQNAGHGCPMVQHSIAGLRKNKKSGKSLFSSR
ncbi:hypothetical protein SSYIS1_28420 [Serratia symbiotica]|uniref:Uncharacterized protein n=1 Tax=Serratia symbiotica TaxID=138074 RepID=A0A455VQF0_9GAMM|nr:hypothetical protein SSYIS1_28420 [Serratia symbiotica]